MGSITTPDQTTMPRRVPPARAVRGQAEQGKQARVAEGDDPRAPGRGDHGHRHRVRAVGPTRSAPG